MSLLRSLMVVLVWTAFAGHVSAAQSLLTAVAGDSSGAVPSSQQFRVRLGERLNILATGDIALDIDKARVIPGGLTLLLDDIPVPGLRFSTRQLSDKPENGLLVSFDLARRSEDDANRSAGSQARVEGLPDGHLQRWMA